MTSSSNHGTLHPASEKKFSETVVFIHPFGVTEKFCFKHAEFVNQIGFDAFTFSLQYGQKVHWQPTFSSDLKLGMIPVWSEQVETVLNKISGRKILYGFSSPCAAGLNAIARRNMIDVAAMVCDGGPFLNYYRSIWNLFSSDFKIKNPIVRALAAGASKILFGPDFEKQTEETLHQLSEDFPILSIQGWRDHLVSPESIQAFFARKADLNLEVLSIPEGDHLNGLKDFPDVYKPRVEAFLNKYATTFP